MMMPVGQWLRWIRNGVDAQKQQRWTIGHNEWWSLIWMDADHDDDDDYMMTMTIHGIRNGVDGQFLFKLLLHVCGCATPTAHAVQANRRKSQKRGPEAPHVLSPALQACRQTIGRLCVQLTPNGTSPTANSNASHHMHDENNKVDDDDTGWTLMTSLGLRWSTLMRNRTASPKETDNEGSREDCYCSEGTSE
eukprot:6302086-Amphidinium_carterae.1